MTSDFYELLGVDEDASKNEIRDAFREMVQEYHPDRNDDPRATAQFTAIKKAYDTLKDPNERQSYDRLGHTDYVAKRLDGMPDPSSWPSHDDEEDDDADSSATSSGTSSVSSSGASGTAGSATGSASGTTSSTGSTAGTGYSSGTTTSTGGTSSSTGGSSTTSSSSTSSTTGSSSGTTSRSSRSTAGGASGSATSSSSRSGTTGSSSSSGGGTSGSSSGSGPSSTASTTGTTSSAAGSSGSGSTATTGATGRASATGTATTGTGSTATGTSTGGATTSTGSPQQTTTNDAADTDSAGGLSGLLFENALARWFGSVRLGWPAIILSFGLYLAGLAHYGYENADGLEDLIAYMRAGEVDALQAALLGSATEYVPTSAWEYVYVTDPAAIGPSIVFALGTVVMPLVFFLVIRRTRQYRGRDLSYLFALAVFAPLVVLTVTGVDAAYGVIETIPLAAVLVGYGVVPLLAGLFLIGRRWVWTPLRNRLRS